MKKLVLIPGLILAASAAFALPAVAAEPSTGPATNVCADAKVKLVVAVKLTVLYNADVYPDSKVPAVADITPAYLGKVLADPDLGGGARIEVKAAVAAFAAVNLACTPPVVVTTTPTATPTATPTVIPTTTVAATPTVVIPTGSFSQIGTAPVGSVDTGGGPA